MHEDIIHDINLDNLEHGSKKFKGINQILNKYKNIISNLNNTNQSREQSRLSKTKTTELNENMKNITPDVKTNDKTNDQKEREQEGKKINCINFDSVLKRENNITPLSDSKMLSRENID